MSSRYILADKDCRILYKIHLITKNVLLLHKKMWALIELWYFKFLP